MNDLKKELSELLRKEVWTEEEKEQMLNYLNSPDTEQLKQLMRGQFTEDGPDLLEDGRAEELLYSIHEKIGIKKQEKTVKVFPLWLRRTAVAASLILLVGFGFKFFYNNGSVSQLAKTSKKNEDSLPSSIRHEVNATGKDRKIQLPDGSQVLLASNSELTFREPFIKDRKIILTGKAGFKVAKDKANPFRVFSGAVFTTAIGTEFTVTAYKQNNWLTVRLYEGKVVVKATAHGDNYMKRDFYLLPSQEFVYCNNALAKVRSFSSGTSNNAIANMAEKAANDFPLISEENDGSWYMFNNQTLENVFNDLSSLYGKKILYERKDIKNIYFTGKYNKSRPLDAILKRIARLNNLKVTKDSTSYTISK